MIKEALKFQAGEALTHGAFHVEQEVFLKHGKPPAPNRGGNQGRADLNKEPKDERLRIDLRFRGLEDPSVVTDVDVRCFYPDAHSYSNTDIEKVFQIHEKEKYVKYQKTEVDAEGQTIRCNN